MNFDVAVVGAGHAGLEAALAAARLGMQVGLFTFEASRIAQMSCNPAIGGVAKGQLAREVDALGGIMGILTDQAMIHFRMLNRSKGPAVQSPRAQADRKHYTRVAIEAVCRQENLSLIEGEVTELLFEKDHQAPSGHRVVGVKLSHGVTYGCRAAILTTGTFLKSLMHQGECKSVGGRVGEQSAEHLSESLLKLNLRLGRLKTGTPARLHRATINWSVLEEQPSEPLDYRFSYWGGRDLPRLVEEGIPCYLTHTNEQTHAVIRKNFDRSPLFSGEIQGIGPRYCPSIEDKVKRFADKNSHHVFLEPDGLDVDEIYPNGVSTSLPADVQLAFLRTIPGLEEVELIRPGYAVEYDYVDPTQLLPSLSLKTTPTLFLAGQINGTSGYEEAAGQGIIAGINAALFLMGKAPFVLGRDEAYIGVLIDDLVTRGATEPYRMFTSRAEHRLILRQDNADIRLASRAAEIGMISEEIRCRIDKVLSCMQEQLQSLRSTRIVPNQQIRERVESISPGEFRKPATLEEVLVRNGVTYPDLEWIMSTNGETREDYMLNFSRQDEESRRAAEQVEILVKYRGYLERQYKQIEEQKRLESRPLPVDLNYMGLEGMRMEARFRLEHVKPLTLGQASRVEGVSPADIAVLIAWLRKDHQ